MTEEFAQEHGNHPRDNEEEKLEQHVRPNFDAEIEIHMGRAIEHVCHELRITEKLLNKYCYIC